MKIQRFNAKLKFKPIIDKLYKEALQQQKIWNQLNQLLFIILTYWIYSYV